MFYKFCESLSYSPLLFFHSVSLTRSVSLSEWSEWTSCSPCVPASSLLQSGSAVDVGEGAGVHATAAALVSVQRRYRACLDVDSGLPINGREGECSKPLEEERICPQPDICNSTLSLVTLYWHECAKLHYCQSSEHEQQQKNSYPGYTHSLSFSLSFLPATACEEAGVSPQRQHACRNLPSRLPTA